MEQDLDPQKAEEILRAATAPARCTVQYYDFDAMVKVQLCNDDGSPLLETDLLKIDFVSPRIGVGLPTKIALIRQRLEELGAKLDCCDYMQMIESAATQ